MGNTVKKVNSSIILKLQEVFSSIIYIVKELSSDEKQPNSNLEEKVKKIQQQESGYINKLEESTTNTGNKDSRKGISVRKVKNINKTQFPEENIINRENEEKRI